jgi:hypothetical protein
MDISVGIATSHSRVIGILFEAAARDFSLLRNRLWGPPSLVYKGGSVLSPGLKRPSREPDHSHPTSTEMEYVDLYSPFPHTSSRPGA